MLMYLLLSIGIEYNIITNIYKFIHKVYHNATRRGVYKI
jgi:hypothetical protein